MPAREHPFDQAVRHLRRFPSAVLSSVDVDGYPASLLCHSMNEQLWNLQSFAVRGVLEEDGGEWCFRPLRFIPGSGMSNAVKGIFAMRRQAGAYLRTRGEQRPKVPWAKIKAAKQRTQDEQPGSQ